MAKLGGLRDAAIRLPEFPNLMDIVGSMEGTPVFSTACAKALVGMLASRAPAATVSMASEHGLEVLNWLQDEFIDASDVDLMHIIRVWLNSAPLVAAVHCLRVHPFWSVVLKRFADAYAVH